MRQRTPQSEPGIDHIFWDAEGTLWVPRPGRDFRDFWRDPDPQRAEEVFEPSPWLSEALDALDRLGCRHVVVSRHDVNVLPLLLRRFGLADRFTDVLVNGHKGARVRQWLHVHELDPGRALMVGDRYDLDIGPLQQFGIRAALLDRPYNAEYTDVLRIHDLRDLAGLVQMTRPRPEPADPAHVRALESGTWTGLAPVES